ncbi:Serine/arginine-rich splicing factor 12 [Glycine soja]|nr:Serine/arginine-rich splicing factor 12 [Glycine soja]
MRRNSPAYYSPPRRGYGGGGRGGGCGRGGGGGGGGGGSGRRGFGGGRRRDSNGSLLVRNIPLDCRPEELRVPFERFGPVRDVYIPKDYYSGEPRGFAFVQFVDPYDASEAQYHMNRQIFAGREISVVVAEETRKRPEEMRHRTSRLRGPAGYGGQRSSRYGRSRSRSVTRSRSPPYHSGSRNRYRSRHVSLKSYSPAPRRQSDYSVSPRRQAEHPRSPRGPPRERDGEQKRRSYSPAYGNGIEQNQSNGYAEKSMYKSDADRGQWKSSRSPPGSRSRSAELSPRRGR